MGRPLYGTQPHSTSCTCQACSASASPVQAVSTSAPRHNPAPAALRPSRLTLGAEPPAARLTEQDLLQTLSSSRESIQRVTTAIEAAYDRLIALTSRLQESLDTMSNDPAPARTATNMGPDHSAILLSEPTSLEPDAGARNSTASDSSTTLIVPSMSSMDAQISVTKRSANVSWS